ncbi:MAG: UDP-N-acetylglucosamine 1-carboxyvinyltransferase [Firmicutes bacterium]|nr:UDP-N-acetylglucosamine 1-carboxyvinyltransferase [Bacillota bacterium]
MSKFTVEGKQRLSGLLKVNGAKNSALKLMAASLLGQGIFWIEDVPQIADVLTMCGVLRALGVEAELANNRLNLVVNSLQGRPPWDLVRSMRASIQIMGPLLAKLGWVEVAKPGGCAIGARPLDLHLSGFEKMGAVIETTNGLIKARAKRLQGADITLRYPSVGATENIMMAAVLARGETIIRNAAREPEIVDIQNFLNKMGARIEGAGGALIKIKGVTDLGAADFKVIPDRIEAGTYILAALISQGEITLENIVPEHLGALLDVVKTLGGEIEFKNGRLTVHSPAKLKPFEVSTNPYPGFPTDLQPQLVVVATQAGGLSTLRESVFNQRFGYIPQLEKMGARIKVKDYTAFIQGHSPLNGANLVVSDLRAGAALVLAALAARGESAISGIEHIDRGYEQMEEKLSLLGAKIKRSLGKGGLSEK